MHKLSSVVLAGILALSSAASSWADKIDLTCDADPVSPAPTSFILLKKGPGETVYTQINELPSCAFLQVEILDTGETCFRFGAKSGTHTTIRVWSRVCQDPSMKPIPGPAGLHIK